jgi:hypothetical protein
MILVGSSRELQKIVFRELHIIKLNLLKGSSGIHNNTVSSVYNQLRTQNLDCE